MVARLVNGIDVHPVAAEIARATLLRALPAEPPGGKAGIRIYEGDSLLVNADDERSLFRPLNGEIRVATPRGREVLLPRSFVDLPTFTDDLRRLVEEAGEGRPLSPDIANSVPEADRAAVEACHAEFVKIVKREGNSVWTWYIANTTGPMRLSGQKVDRMVANPPWVSMAEIQAERRKRDLERFADSDLGLWSGGRNAPHFDIAQLFIKRARMLYLSNPDDDPAAWIVKKSALRAQSWGLFREWHKGVLAQSLDLEAVRPFGGGDARRCCVLFEARRTASLAPGAAASALRALCPDGRPEAHTSPDRARELLVFEDSPAPLPRRRSPYVGSEDRTPFRQGATVSPRVLLVAGAVADGPSDRELTVTTVRSKRKPWTEIEPQTGVVPRHWVRDLVTSKEMFAFAIGPELLKAIVPTDGAGRLERAPAGLSPFWGELDAGFDEFRGRGRSTPESLIAQLDHNGKLSAQLTRTGTRRMLVLYPKSGDIMRGARSRPGSFVVDDTLYHFRAGGPGEAGYLTALLNATCLRRAFRESRTSGRHFDQQPWRAIPIPRYDAADEVHRDLVRLCNRAERVAGNWLVGQTTRYGQVAASGRIVAG